MDSIVADSPSPSTRRITDRIFIEVSSSAMPHISRAAMGPSLKTAWPTREFIGAREIKFRFSENRRISHP